MLNPDPAAGEGAFAVPGMPWVAAASVLINQKNPNTLRWNPAAGEGAFAVPGMPWVAAASVLLNVFLLGSVKAASWRLFAAWVAATLAFYLAYSMPASYAHHALERCAHPLNLLNLYWRKTLLCTCPTACPPRMRTTRSSGAGTPAQTLRTESLETPAACPARIYMPSENFPANPADMLPHSMLCRVCASC